MGKRDENGMIPRITKTYRAVLQEIDGVRLPIGEFTLTEKEPGPTLEQFGDEAFKFARSSLAKLMPHRYRIVLIDAEGQESAYGLDRWVKLVDREKEHEGPLQGKGAKQTVRSK